MLTLGAYVQYVRHSFSLARYAAVVGTFALGLMSKPIMMTLPAVLLLLDGWPLGRMTSGGDGLPFRDPSEAFLRWLPDGRKGGLSAAAGTTLAIEEGSSLRWRLAGLVLEKIPLLALAAVFALQSVQYEKENEVVLPDYHVAIEWRMANGLVADVTYLGQTVFPVHLTVLYPHPGIKLPVWKIIGAAVVLLCISTRAS